MTSPIRPKLKIAPDSGQVPAVMTGSFPSESSDCSCLAVIYNPASCQLPHHSPEAAPAPHPSAQVLARPWGWSSAAPVREAMARMTCITHWRAHMQSQHLLLIHLSHPPFAWAVDRPTNERQQKNRTNM